MNVKSFIVFLNSEGGLILIGLVYKYAVTFCFLNLIPCEMLHLA